MMERKRHIPKPRILIVEDDPDQADLIRESLCAYYKDDSLDSIVHVATANECLAQNLGRFDVVLTDYNLPDMEGLKLIAAILARCDIPVIVVTGENVSDTASKAIQHGAQDYVVKLGDYLFTIPLVVDKNIRQHQINRENLQLQKQLQQTLEELRTSNAQLQQAEQKQRLMATLDHLTGLANRRSFDEILHRSFNEANRYGFDLTCCMCDLDHYKHINDTLGHQAGDELLVAASEVIRSSLRSTDTAARYGGDEFVLLFPHTSMAKAVEITHRIRTRLDAVVSRFAHSGKIVTMSMGASSLKTDRPQSADILLSLADRALYTAKERGRNQIVVFSNLQCCTQV